jgi:FkbM family methyltransferase
MSAQVMQRAWQDFQSVRRHASPATATRWSTGLIRHLPECARLRSLEPADRTWASAGGRFRTSTGAVIDLPGAYTAGAREMYCRDVYLRTGLVMPSRGWVVDLGANRGLFSVWVACNGASALAVEAQQGFAPEIRELAAHNRVSERVRVETAIASGASPSSLVIGDLADDHVWAAASHATPQRPATKSIPALMVEHGIDCVGLLKMDIEGGEFAVLAADEDLAWLEQVDQLAIELHAEHGDTGALTGRLRGHGFTADVRNDRGSPIDPTSPTAAYGYFHR